MKRLASLFAGIWVYGVAVADIGFRNLDDPDAPVWAEEAIQLPALPEEKSLLEFYVSEMTAHRFFVDGNSIHAGKDGVVRFTLVVRTSGGTINITHEGIRCETREFKLYASGRQDGTWSAARKPAWRPIENKPMNRHHAALSRDFFCPAGMAIRSPDEGRDALRRGKHPQSF